MALKRMTSYYRACRGRKRNRFNNQKAIRDLEISARKALSLSPSSAMIRT